MPDDPQKPDSLDNDRTFTGEQDVPQEEQRSLGDQATAGDALSSISDLSEMADDLGDAMPLVDLNERYKIQDVLGKGGMGKVLRALDTRLDRPVAIKRILGEMARSTKALSRFRTEAKSIAALNHFNIVQIYDYGRDTEGPFIIMELVEGESLQEKLKEDKLEVEEAVDITCQLCDALSKAHGAGIIHRDIKPANILLTEDGVPKLTDFGLARQESVDHGQTQAGAVLGTIDFMPPEQRRDATATDGRSDLWSLAATFYQMVTGKSPRIINFKNVPQALQDVLQKALEEEQIDRYQTAREFRDALNGSLKTAAEPASEVGVDLGAGECAQCHTMNDASRKFCRECGVPLRVSCLACEEEIPIWDKVCPECGGKQPELAAVRREEIDAQREQAESLRSEYAFDKSLDIAREIASIEDSRLQQLKEWSETFIGETNTAKEQQEQNATTHYAEAKAHREAYDYKSAIQAMETIPEVMLTSEMSSYLQQLQSDNDESQELVQTIKERVTRRDLEGLLDQVSRAVELRPDWEDLQTLQTQLTERREKLIKQRDEAYSEAESLLREGQAKKAYGQISGVTTQDLRASDVKLRTQLEEIVAAEEALSALVKESKADGVLDPEEVAAMWEATDEYLKLNPHHEKIAKMQKQLVDRIKSAPAKYECFREKELAHYFENPLSAPLAGKLLTKEIAKKFLEDEDSVYFSDFEVIGLEAAQALAEHKDSLSLNGLTSLSVEVAQALAKHNDMLWLNGLTSLSVEVAKALAKHTGHLWLNGLTSLSVEVAQALAEHQGTFYCDDALSKRLPSDVVRILQDGPTRLTLDIAERFLADSGSLSLDIYKTIDLEAAEAVAKHKDELSLGGLTSLSVEVAQALAKHNDYLFLDGLTSLSVEAAQALAEHQGTLYCDYAFKRLPSDVVRILQDGPTRLTLDVAERFLADSGSLNLDSYKTIDLEAAQALAKHKDELSLDGLTSLSVEAAQALAEHKDSLSLDGLTSLSVEAAQALAKHTDTLWLRGLTSLSVEAAQALAEHQGTLYCDDAFKRLPSDVVRILQNNPNRLTLDVAEHFLADDGYILSLGIYGTIDLEAAEALAKHTDGLWLNSLTSLSVEVAEALAKHKDALSLDGLTSLSVEVAEALAKHKDALSLHGLTSLSVEVAQALAKHKDALSLHGLTSLSVEVAEALAKHTGHLCLEGLASLTVEAAQALAKHKGRVSCEKLPPATEKILRTMTREAAEYFLEHEAGLFLDDFEAIDLDAAEALAKHTDGLWLNSLTSLSVEVAEALAKHKDALSLHGLKSLSVEVAQALAKTTASLWLDGLTNLSVEAAQALAEHKDSISLDGLTFLTAEVAEALAEHNGSLSLGGLRSLLVGAAQALAKHNHLLSLAGLKRLSVEVAEALVKHNDLLELDGLMSLSPEVAQTLAKHNDTISLNGLTSLSVDGQHDSCVKLTSFGERKLDVVREVGAITGLSLIDAKKLVESVPVIIRKDLSKEDAEKIVTELEKAGAEARLHDLGPRTGHE